MNRAPVQAPGAWRRRPLVWVWPAALAVGVLDFAAGLHGHSGRLDPAAEGSPFSWASALAALVAAACVIVLAKRSRGMLRLRRVLLAAALGYVAVDEALGLHERLAADLDPRALETLDWHAVALVATTLLLGVVVVLLVLEVRSVDPLPAMIVAGVVLLVLALGARLGGGVLAALDALPGGETRHTGEAAAHACGLAGWTLIAAGLLALVRSPSE